ncbi:bifunctional lysylphosphatidylglycerol flippase/synthetase MprF [Cellulosimicrobium sp. Marseille-Q8652]
MEPAPAPATSPAVRSPLEEQRHRVRVRVVASRVVLALGILGVVAVLVRGLWTHLTLYRDVVPGLLPGTASTTLLVDSVVLLLTARGLRRGHRLAWLVTVVVLGLTAGTHTARGVDVVPSVVVLAAAVWLATRWRSFPVLPTRRAVRRAGLLLLLLVGAWVLAIAALVVVVLRADDPEGALDGGLVTAVAVVSTVVDVVVLVLVLWWLGSPREARRLAPAEHREERERARAVVERYGGGTLDYFALRDDKDWFFVGRSVVAHSVRGGVCLVSPDPIGPDEERETVWAEMLDHAASSGWSIAVVAAAEGWLPVYERSGLRHVYLGDEATVDCTTFTLAGHDHKSLRQAVNRVARSGYATTFHDPATLDPGLREQILAMSDESRQGEDERGFSMTLSRLFDPDDAGLVLSVTRNADGRVDAFCQWVPAAAIDGWSLDVMRRRTDADDVPNGLIDATIVATIGEVAARGMRGLGLNFAVMREVLEGERDGRVDQLARPVLRRLSKGTQMATLGAFNEKFDPGWTPRYVVLDSAEYTAAQALVLAGAEGVTEIPVVGRFLRGVGTAP